MALQCRIVRADNGSIDYIKTEEGTRSALFDSLVSISNKETAYDLYALTETEEFKNTYFNLKKEPTVEEVLNFANNEIVELSQTETADVRNSVINLGMTSTGQLLNSLKNTLMPKGVVVFERNSMERSGIWNQYEINSILENKSIQDSIKRVIKGMSSLESESIPEYDALFSVRNGKLNSLGKESVINPFQVEKEVTEIIAGTDIEDSIEKIPFDSIKNSFYNSSETRNKLTKKASNTRVISEKQIVEGEIIDKPLNKVYERLSQVMDFGNRESIISKIRTLTSITPTVWNTSENAVFSLLKDLNKSSVSVGVDLESIENSVYTKDYSEMMDFLLYYQNVMENPSEDNLQDFANVYTSFFNLEGISTVVAQTSDSSNIFLETDLSEYTLFSEQGLIKTGNNIYTPVEIIEDLDEVYSTMAANTNLLPSTVTNEEELREYVQSQMNSMDIPDFKVDTEQLEKMILYKMYFKSPIFRDSTSDLTQNYLQFTGDYNYLTQEYPSDFYRMALREKKKNSEVFKNYYSHFKITDNGIELINNDPITLRTIMEYASDELKQYNLLSKNLNLPVEYSNTSVDFNEMIYNREQAISNPNSIPKLNKDYTILSPITIAVKNETESFVRTPVGVFEIDYQIGNVSFYNILPKSDSKYNSLGLYKSKTDSDLNLQEYGFLQDSPESFTRAKNYYNESELRKINQEHFGCS